MRIQIWNVTCSLRHTRDAYSNLERDLFAAREELDDYVVKLKKAYKIDG